LLASSSTSNRKGLGGNLVLAVMVAFFGTFGVTFVGAPESKDADVVAISILMLYSV
jgi:hypothetical protein